MLLQYHLEYAPQARQGSWHDKGLADELNHGRQALNLCHVAVFDRVLIDHEIMMVIVEMVVMAVVLVVITIMPRMNQRIAWAANKV